GRTSLHGVGERLDILVVVVDLCADADPDTAGAGMSLHFEVVVVQQAVAQGDRFRTGGATALRGHYTDQRSHSGFLDLQGRVPARCQRLCCTPGQGMAVGDASVITHFVQELDAVGRAQPRRGVARADPVELAGEAGAEAPG